MSLGDGILRVGAIEIGLRPYDWAFARDQAARVDAHWLARVARTPSLFDGRVLLSRDLSVEGGRLRGACFETDYRSFLSWRDFGFPGAPVTNCFGMPALRAADGAFMLGEMSADTANAGQLYFPAGTPERSDIGPDGCIDFEANILRELAEETGLTRADVSLDPDWTVVCVGPRLACMKIARTPLDAAAIQARLKAFNAGQTRPELTRMVAVRGPADLDADRMPGFMLDYLAWILSA